VWPWLLQEQALIPPVQEGAWRGRDRSRGWARQGGVTWDLVTDNWCQGSAASEGRGFPRRAVPSRLPRRSTDLCFSWKTPYSRCVALGSGVSKNSPGGKKPTDSPSSFLWISNPNSLCNFTEILGAFH